MGNHGNKWAFKDRPALSAVESRVDQLCLQTNNSSIVLSCYTYFDSKGEMKKQDEFEAWGMI